MKVPDITVRIDPAPWGLLLRWPHLMWELRWEKLTGVPWSASRGEPRAAEFDVTLGRMPHDSHVRIRGTALEVHCRKAEVIHEVGDVGVLRLEIPMVGSTVKVRT